MIRKILAIQIIVSFLFVSCSSKQPEVYAKIIERKHLEGGKLLISYSFSNEGKLYNGDTTINNTIIPNDSVLVIFSPDNPAKSKLRIP